MYVRAFSGIYSFNIRDRILFGQKSKFLVKWIVNFAERNVYSCIFQKLCIIMKRNNEFKTSLSSDE